MAHQSESERLEKYQRAASLRRYAKRAKAVLKDAIKEEKANIEAYEEAAERLEDEASGDAKQPGLPGLAEDGPLPEPERIAPRLALAVAQALSEDVSSQSVEEAKKKMRDALKPFASATIRVGDKEISLKK